MIRPVSSHAVDATAISAPVLSIAAHLPQFMTVITALLGGLWYAVQLYDRFRSRPAPAPDNMRATQMPEPGDETPPH